MAPRVAVLKDVDLSDIELSFCIVYYIVQGNIRITEVELCSQKTQMSLLICWA